MRGMFTAARCFVRRTVPVFAGITAATLAATMPRCAPSAESAKGSAAPLAAAAGNATAAASPAEDEARRALMTALELTKAGEYDRAERLLRAALDADDRSSHAVEILTTLSQVYLSAGRNADSQTALQRALDVLGPVRKLSLGDKEKRHIVMQMLVKVKVEGGQVEEAERISREELQSLRRRGGSDEADVAFALAWSDVLAGILLQQRKADQAEVLLRSSLQSVRTMMAQAQERAANAAKASAGASGGTGHTSADGKPLPPAVQRLLDEMEKRAKAMQARGRPPTDEEKEADAAVLRELEAEISEADKPALLQWAARAAREAASHMAAQMAQAGFVGIAARSTVLLAESLCQQARPVEQALAGSGSGSAAASATSRSAPSSGPETDAALAKGAEGRLLHQQLVGRSHGAGPVALAIGRALAEANKRSPGVFDEPPLEVAQRGREALAVVMKKHQGAGAGAGRS